MDQWKLDLALLLRETYEGREGRRQIAGLLGCGMKQLWHMENNSRRPPLAVRQALRRLAVMEGEHEQDRLV
jgi:hypothetical protein